MNRREFLRTSSAVAGCLLVSQTGYAKTSNAAFTLWQLPEQTRSQMNSYVIQTAGNELVVLDGGRTGDAAYLRNFIKERGNHVHAWFISHPHLDHAEALTAILNNLGDMKIDKIYGPLPEDGWLKKHQNAGAFKTQQALKAAMNKEGKKLQDTKPGQTIGFTKTTFTVLSGLNPEITANAVNNSSIVLRADGGDESVLFLGDLGVEGGKKLLASEYRAKLEADYVQMSHHGQGGVDEDFYKAVKPKYCLWPTPGWLWGKEDWRTPMKRYKTHEVRGWMAKLDIKKHYIAKDGLHQIEVPTTQ